METPMGTQGVGVPLGGATTGSIIYEVLSYLCILLFECRKQTRMQTRMQGEETMRYRWVVTRRNQRSLSVFALANNRRVTYRLFGTSTSQVKQKRAYICVAFSSLPVSEHDFLVSHGVITRTQKLRIWILASHCDV